MEIEYVPDLSGIIERERLFKPIDIQFNTEKMKFGETIHVKPELPKKYIINNDATILFWKDGSKTIVKRCKEDEFNSRLGFLTAWFQRFCGLSKNKANKYLAELKITEDKKEKQSDKEENDEELILFHKGDKIRLKKRCSTINGNYVNKNSIGKVLEDSYFPWVEFKNGFRAVVAPNDATIIERSNS